jgi:Ca2+-binding RTX toxin-like protein
MRIEQSSILAQRRVLIEFVPTSDDCLALSTQAGLEIDRLESDDGIDAAATIEDAGLDLNPGTDLILPAPEFIIGTTEDDRLVGTDAGDGIRGLPGNDVLIGGGGADMISGDRGNDRLRGGRDLDFLFGGAGRDTLLGNSGRDYLDGEAGNDRLRGGRGADQFLLRLNAGRDVIQDFTDGEDELVMFQTIPFEDLDIVQQGQNTVIRYGDRAAAVLTNVDASLITADDFGVSILAVI